ncbi:MAG: thioredoxin family protein [Myxococcota bacterium]
MRSTPPRLLFAWLSSLVLCLWFGLAHADTHRTAEAHGAPEGGEDRLTARLWATPSEGAWRIGLELVPSPGWHVYWRNAGDTGLPPKVAWGLEGSDAAPEMGPLAWPAPEAFYDREIDLLSYGYARPVLLVSEARFPDDATAVVADVEALVCAHVCLPARFALRAPLSPAPAEVVARFDAESARVPLPSEAVGVSVRLVEPVATNAEGQLRARLRVEPCGSAEDCDWRAADGSFPFFPYASEAADWRASAATPVADGRAGAFEIALVGEPLDESALAPHPAGVLSLVDASGTPRSVEIDLREVPVATATALPAASDPTPGGLGEWLRALLLGWVGGLILNLMPCVLPVLAIKLAGLAQLAQGSHHEHRRHAAAYMAGIGLSMLALALVVLALRSAGHAVGWGFQLQEPGFLVAVSCLLVAFALNLFGGFEILVDTSRLSAIGSNAPGAGRSFFDGLLAVALATPCSAPFLGTAVGFAFASSAPVIITIFLSIGLGLATPFLLAAAFPGWARRMPRSGPWMSDLRGFLAFALLLTVVWLLWILGRASGPEAVIATLMLLVAVAFVGFLLGLLQRRGVSVSAAVFAVAMIAVTTAGIGAIDLTPQSRAEPEAPAIESALPYSADAVSASLAEGRPVFVYFTADWCVTCKVNEKGVLADPSLAETLSQLDYVVYRADWTRRDDRIRGALAALGKAGVPVYALYAPGAAAPRLLPELLTRDGLRTALREVAGAAPRS